MTMIQQKILTHQNINHRMNLKKFIINDKRRSPRFKTRIPCNLFLHGYEVPGTIMDLSMEGAKILPNRDINESAFNLQFYMDNKTLSLKCSRITQIAECISVEFIQVDKNLKASLNYILSIIDLGENMI